MLYTSFQTLYAQTHMHAHTHTLTHIHDLPHHFKQHEWARTQAPSLRMFKMVSRFQIGSQRRALSQPKGLPTLNFRTVPCMQVAHCCVAAKLSAHHTTDPNHSQAERTGREVICTMHYAVSLLCLVENVPLVLLNSGTGVLMFLCRVGNLLGAGHPSGARMFAWMCVAAVGTFVVSGSCHAFALLTFCLSSPCFHRQGLSLYLLFSLFCSLSDTP